MKKFLSLLLSTMLIIACLFTATGCNVFSAKPEFDLDDAEDNLLDADYVVTYYDDEEYLDINEEECLYAGDDKDNYLYITVYKDLKSAKIAYKELKSEYEEEIDWLKRSIKYYENLIKNYEDELEDEDYECYDSNHSNCTNLLDHYKKYLKEDQKDLKEYKEEVSYGRKGRIVWEGTKNAIEDSKG